MQPEHSGLISFVPLPMDNLWIRVLINRLSTGTVPLTTVIKGFQQFLYIEVSRLTKNECMKCVCPETEGILYLFGRVY